MCACVTGVSGGVSMKSSRKNRPGRPTSAATAADESRRIIIPGLKIIFFRSSRAASGLHLFQIILDPPKMIIIPGSDPSSDLGTRLCASLEIDRARMESPGIADISDHACNLLVGVGAADGR